MAVRLRLARLRDLGTLVHLYRHRSERSWAFYHPFPADRLRLTIIFAWLILTRRWVGSLMRRIPGWCGVVVVALLPGSPKPIGYGTVRPEVDTDGEMVAKFGFLVEDHLQNRGIGKQIMIAQAYVTRELGIRKAHGTIIAGNVPSRRTAERFGWRIWATNRPDLHAPGQPNMEAAVDLEEIFRRVGDPTRIPPGALPGRVTDQSLGPTDRAVDPVGEAHALGPSERAKPVIARDQRGTP